MTIDLALITCRINCHFDWLADSITRELASTPLDLRLIVVDFHVERDVRKDIRALNYEVLWVEPKPNVWSGPYRLPKENWWSISSSRNTALCLARDGYVAFVDDRSVLVPGWLRYAKEAMDGKYAAFGSYVKCNNVVVENGLVAKYELRKDGRDHRLDLTSDRTKATRCSGQWCFGCGSVLPLEWALQVGGYDEACDGLSFEDVIFGLMLEKHGFDLRYDPRMMVIQDRTPELLEPPFRRTDKGVSPFDKSHAILNMVHGGRHVAPNYFGDGGIRAVRKRVLEGEPFPITQCPEADWFDGQLIKDMV